MLVEKCAVIINDLGALGPCSSVVVALNNWLTVGAVQTRTNTDVKQYVLTSLMVPLLSILPTTQFSNSKPMVVISKVGAYRKGDLLLFSLVQSLYMQSPRFPLMLVTPF